MSDGSAKAQLAALGALLRAQRVSAQMVKVIGHRDGYLRSLCVRESHVDCVTHHPPSRRDRHDPMVV